MFCPECKAEYRPGFTHCNDCDVDLVEELSDTDDASADSPGGADLVVVWTGADEGECAAVCDRLEENEIRFEVTRQTEDFFYGGVSQRLEIRVPAEDDEEKAPLDDPIDRNVDWDPRNWHPEDATEQVWAGDDPPLASMVAASLRELHIHTRTDTLDDGSQQIFVMPEQESRAREIVRQIVDASPL